MRPWAVLVALVLLARASAACAQDQPVGAPSWDAIEGKVVLYSPHYDTPIPEHGGLNCPGGPMHLFGFLGEATGSAEAELRVRTLVYLPWNRRGVPPPAEGRDPKDGAPLRATVMLTSRIEQGREEPLPSTPPWMAVADEAGLTTLRVPAGVYRIHFEDRGIWQDGIVRVRPASSDSVQAFFLPVAMCQE